jgi:putative ABC transport system substrate-binding protein
LQLVRLRADVIVVTNPQAAFSAKRATATIPIVMAHTPDPVLLGLVSSLARPGGNITGTTTLSVDLSIKQLELLKEAIPQAVRIAVLANPESPWHPLVVKGLRGANVLLGVQLQILEIRHANGLDAAFRAMVRERAQGVLVLADPMTFHHRGRLADLAVKHGLPLMGGPRGYTEAGGLMSYRTKSSWADGSPAMSTRF